MRNSARTMVAKVWLLLAIFTILDCCLSKSCDTSEDEGDHEYYTHSADGGQVSQRQLHPYPASRSWSEELNDSSGRILRMLEQLEGQIKMKCPQCRSSDMIEVISYRRKRDSDGDTYLVKVNINFGSPDVYKVLHIKFRRDEDETKLMSFIEADELAPLEPWDEDEDEDDEDGIIDSILDLFF